MCLDLASKPKSALVCVLISLWLGACSDAPEELTMAKDRTHPQATVNTLNGALTGEKLATGIHVYRGIPYAKPPVGELRWRPPEAYPAWSGERDAATFSASCTQPTHSSAFVWKRGDFEVSEDCLYLNVWAKSGARDLPVMVWFHGGAHTSGQGHSQIFDGENLASLDVVIITINYRLGALGFLAHPWLNDESDHNSSGNYGLLDKIAALNWVRDNVEQFGGNPDNVTIFGQSAGSQSVCSLMASPLAAGLFHKAIGQSAACLDPAPGRDMAGHERGRRLVDELSISDLASLRKVSPEQILTATERSGWSNASRIVIDGWVLAEPQIDTFRDGRQAQVPLMVGCLADEGVGLFPVNEALTEAELNAYLARLAGDQASAIKAAYVQALEGSPGTIQHAIATDLFMAFAMRRWAEYQHRTAQPTYLYFMDHVPPAFHLYMPEDPDMKLPSGPRPAAYHSGDLAFVFANTGKVGLAWNEEDHALSHTMALYWTNFARTGNPNGKGLVEWRPFEAEEFTTQRLNASPESVPGIRRTRLDLLAKANPL